MNKDKVRLWVDALRSGQYVQGTGGLKLETPEGAQYCCLGVACDVAIKDGVKVNQRAIGARSYIEFNETSGFLPEAVMAWLGTDTDSPMVLCRNDSDFEQTLTYLNDTEGWGFGEIADAIERTFLKEDTK